jgi:hypothetical protein
MAAPLQSQIGTTTHFICLTRNCLAEEQWFQLMYSRSIPLLNVPHEHIPHRVSSQVSSRTRSWAWGRPSNRFTQQNNASRVFNDLVKILKHCPEF